MTARLPLFLLFIAAWLGSTGCSHYQLGTGAKVSFATLAIEPVTVKALIPQSAPIFSTQVRETFVRDGRVTVVDSSASPDATLSLVVKTYDREVATVRPGDTGLARKFVITVTATATLHDNRSGQNLFTDRPIVLKRQLYTDSGQNQAEYQLLPLLAQDLAAKAAHAVLDVW